MKRLYLENSLTAAEVAARLGCSPTTVFRRLAALGVRAGHAGRSL